MSNSKTPIFHYFKTRFDCSFEFCFFFKTKNKTAKRFFHTISKGLMRKKTFIKYKQQLLNKEYESPFLNKSHTKIKHFLTIFNTDFIYLLRVIRNTLHALNKNIFAHNCAVYICIYERIMNI